MMLRTYLVECVHGSDIPSTLTPYVIRRTYHAVSDTERVGKKEDQGDTPSHSGNCQQLSQLWLVELFSFLRSTIIIEHNEGSNNERGGDDLENAYSRT